MRSKLVPIFVFLIVLLSCGKDVRLVLGEPYINLPDGVVPTAYNCDDILKSISLSWDKVTSPIDATGYVVYMGDSLNNLPTSADVGLTLSPDHPKYDIIDSFELDEDYFLAVSAYNATNQSNKSKERVKIRFSCVDDTVYMQTTKMIFN